MPPCAAWAAGTVLGAGSGELVSQGTGCPGSALPSSGLHQILWDAMSFIIKAKPQLQCVTGGLLSADGQLLSRILLHRKATQPICLGCLSIVLGDFIDHYTGNEK